MGQQYDLFFSYRHKPLDTEITEGCFRFAESFRMPKNLQKQGFHGVRRAFRDKEELAVSRILTETIDDALRSADFLVIICTTQTPQSEWVDREIEIFTEEGKAEHIFPLLVDGTPETSFVPALKKIPDIMNRLLDVRCPGSDSKEILQKARNELMRVIAAVAGVSEEQLRREVRLEANRNTLVRSLAGTGFLAGVTAVSVLLCSLAVRYRATAQQAQQASMTVLSELTYGLPDMLVSLPGTYGRTAEVLRDNTAQINDILLLSGKNDAVQAEVASNLERLSDACNKMGLLPDAETAQRQALEELLALQNAPSGRLASAWHNLGNLLNGQGRYNEAEHCYETALELSADSGDAKTRAVILGNRAVNRIASGTDESGLAELAEAIALLEEAVSEPSSEAAHLYYTYGKLLLSRDTVQAEAALGKAVALRRAVLEREPTPQNRAFLVDEAALLGTAYLNGGKYDKAIALYEELLDDAEVLATDRENAQYLQKAAGFLNNYGVALSDVGDHEKADSAYRRAAELYGALSELLQSTESRAVYAQALVNAADNAMMAGNADTGRELFETGFRIYEGIYDSLSDYYKGQYLGYRAYYKLVFGDCWDALDDASMAVNLSGETVIRSYYAFAMMFCGEYDACDEEVLALMKTGAGTVHAMENDLNALARCGAYDPHMEELHALLRG